MSWQVIHPRKRAELAGASAAIGVIGLRKNFYLSIALDAKALPQSWRQGAMLEAATGVGEDFGKLRLSSVGITVFPLRVAPRSKEVLIVRVPLPEGVERAKRVREPVELKRAPGDDPSSIVLSLPRWAWPKPAPTTAAAPPMRSVTAQIMGDPPPGRSAAHARRAGGR